MVLPLHEHQACLCFLTHASCFNASHSHMTWAAQVSTVEGQAHQTTRV